MDERRPGLDLECPPEGGWNFAQEAVFRHARTRGDVVAMRWRGARGERLDLTFAELAARVARFANALEAMGLTAGERVVSLLPRVPELYVAALGTLAHRAVFCPLFTGFGPQPLASRLRIGGARVLVTTPWIYDRRVRPVRAQLDTLRDVMLVDESWTAALEAHPDAYAIGPTPPGTPALLHFTSGTSGESKGVLHAHDALPQLVEAGRQALGLRPGDVVWCTADPGFLAATAYGLLAPLVAGATIVVDEREFDPEHAYATIERERVSVWYTSPAALRKLMQAGPEPARRRKLASLRHVASAGEPLPADAVAWTSEALGRPVHDTWWQTETGSILIANLPGSEVNHGSMGRALPGVQTAIVARTPRGLDHLDGPDVVGELAIRAGWPSMFTAYWGDPSRYAACFVDGWYLTGDLVRRDRDGLFWFIGRLDDAIYCNGHRIGPFEVERALAEHPDVAEAAVIGKPDPTSGERVKAFVALKPGKRPSTAVIEELLGWARARLGTVMAPKELAIVAVLPRTRTGKVLRRLLRARELGLPEGDATMLERTA
jgi:acetyl-CoA synthetase